LNMSFVFAFDCLAGMIWLLNFWLFDGWELLIGAEWL
jgi:hypothetical protein